MTDRLRITRDRLAGTFDDFRQVKQFEKLLSTLQSVESAVNDATSEGIAAIDAKLAELQAATDAARLATAQAVEAQTQSASPPTAGARVATLEDALAALPSGFNVLQFSAATGKWEAKPNLQGVKYGASVVNCASFEDDGTLVFLGTATYWKDIDFLIVIRTTGPNIPVLTTLQGNVTAPQWAVNDFNVCEVQEMDHAWKEGSQSQWHVHMITNGLDATDRYVNWEVEWFWVNSNGVLSATTTTATEVLIPANTASKTMLIRQISTPTLIGGVIGAHVFARLRRIALTTPGRTGPTANPWCAMLQMHIECDTIGSRTISTK